MVTGPQLRRDGTILLPANPWGSAATWADYDWRGIAASYPSNGVANRVCLLIAEAVDNPKDD